MNKKFSTLLAAFAMAAFAGNAATVATDVVKLDKDGLKGMYQLHTGNEILAMGNNDSLLLIDAAGIDSVGVAATLWCVTVTEEGQGKAPIYDFVNKKTGKFLAVSANVVDTLQTGNTSKPIVVGANYQGWAFSKTYQTVLEKNAPMYTYFTKDSVVALEKNGHNIVLKKYLASAAPVTGTLGTAAGFTLKTAADVVLTASEINEYLKGNKDVLTFSPDYKGSTVKNPFSTTAFTVDSVNGFAGTTAADDYGFMFVKAKADSTYLRVDTAWTGTSGEKFLNFAWTNPKGDSKYNGTVKDSILSGNNVLKNQHKFIFTYSPSVDSVFIQVQEARFKPEGTDYWSGVAAKTYAANGDTLFVKLQDLIKDEVRIATIGKQAINTKISFNITGCKPVEGDNASVADGVYFITNKAGQYLAAPIHENGTIEWVTVKSEEQDPAHMPAYQWIVLKDWTSASLSSTSPITFTNREFADKKVSSLQLSQATGAKYYGANAALILGNAVDSLSFTEVPAASVSDSLLGYKNVSAGDLMVNKYTFNYLHPYAQDRFIAKNAGKDSVLNAKTTEPAQFLLKEGNINDYGFEVTKDIQKRIPSLKQLRRTEYVVALGADSLLEAYGSKYAVGQIAKADSFFFKENNHFDGKHYYAIIKSKVNEIDDDASKVGIADDDMSALLKVQVLSETRTSAFAIAPYDEPLYRRFNSEALEGNAGDATDTLRFVEAYRGEILQIENNPTFKVPGIDFMGIWKASDAPSGLSFIVDTAWVNRGYGYIKPQYLISIERNDQPATPGTPCTEAGPHIDANGHITDDASQCIHGTPATPGFQRGKYLVNFADSAAVYADANQNVYKWKGFDRVGFVNAIRIADTLYILRDQFVNLPNNKISIEAIKAADKAAVAKGGKSYIHRLDNDKHKFVTWSMRYMDPKVAANEVETDRSFLFESMKSAAKYGDTTTGDIAPEYATWLKNQNGCLVMSAYDSKFSDLQTGGDDALVFNVKHVVNDEVATDNENVSTSTVSVIAGNGSVAIKGAAGKTVTISNILGQTIANTVLSSDDATIAAPAGVVVVAIEGEAAVKAIVK